MRPTRQLISGASYHVTARTIHGKKLFTKKEKRIFLSYVKKAKDKYFFTLEAFDIMDNHIHLVIRPEGLASLSKIMQWILGNFAQSWNRRHGKKGHFWADRFFSRIIQGFTDLINVIKYVENNPVKAGITTNLSQWIFGSAYYRLINDRSLVGPYPSG